MNHAPMRPLNMIYKISSFGQVRRVHTVVRLPSLHFLLVSDRGMGKRCKNLTEIKCLGKNFKKLHKTSLFPNLETFLELVFHVYEFQGGNTGYLTHSGFQYEYIRRDIFDIFLFSVNGIREKSS